jgi:uncharacterized coiled-coil protein SlyX
MAFDRELETRERIASLEVKSAAHEEDIKAHGEHLQSLDRTVTSLVSELRLIRRALYCMTVALAANNPAMNGALSVVKTFLNL